MQRSAAASAPLWRSRSPHQKTDVCFHPQATVRSGPQQTFDTAALRRADTPNYRFDNRKLSRQSGHGRSVRPFGTHSADQPLDGMRILRFITLLAVLAAGLASCATLPVQEACRVQAAAQGATLTGAASVEPVPESDQVLYQWVGSGVDCLTKRGHVQSVTFYPVTHPE